jgi:hypothetical protein
MEDNIKKTESIWGIIAGVVGMALGMFLGKYNSLAIFIVAVGSVAFYWLAKLANRELNQELYFAIAVLGGHFSWFFIGYLFSNFSYVLLDCSLIALGVIWFLVKPSLPPVILCTGYEILTLIVNIYSIVTVKLDITLFSAGLLHIVLRIAAISLLFFGYKKLKKENQTKMEL